jgi:cytochrome c biogenesis protein CcdA
METLYFDMASALWLGILTSISPCPLATNIAAVSFVARDLASSRRVISAGILYSLGRMFTYVAIAALAVASLLSLPETSFYLERYMSKIIGPVLVLTGVILLDGFRLSFSPPGVGGVLQNRAEKWGLWSAGLLGIVFALTFCPLSAALYFGALVPLAIDKQSTVLMPSLYGLGTAVPVVAFALLTACGVKTAGRVFNAVARTEKWARKATAIVFISAGLYLFAKAGLGF